MPEMTDKCAYAECHCPARMDQDYCSDYCETAGEQPDSVCLCGHPECHLLHTAPQMCQYKAGEPEPTATAENSPA